MKKRITSLCKALLCVVCLFGLSHFAGAQTLLQKIEAESGTIYNFKTAETSKMKVSETADTSHNVGLISNEKYLSQVHPLSYAEYEVNVATEGTYELKIYYMDAYVETQHRRVGININRQFLKTYDTPKKTFAWTGVAGADSTDRENLIEYNGVESMSILVYLGAGKNKVRLGGWRTDNTPWGPNMDYFELYTTTEVIPKPADVPSIYPWSYAREASNITAQHDNASLKNLFDENERTFYTVPGVQKTSITFEYDYPMRMGAFLIYGGPGDTINTTENVTLEYSNNNVDWSVISQKAAKAVYEGQMVEFSAVVPVPSAITKYYYKLTFQTTKADIKIAEFQLFGFPWQTATANYPASLIETTISGSGASKIATGLNGIFTSSAVNPGTTTEVPAHTVDRMQTGKFTAAGKTLWLQYDFNDTKVAKSYAISVAGSPIDGNNAQRNPKTWKLEGSEDFGFTWVTLSEVKDFVFPPATYMCMKFPIDSLKWGDYYSYKLTVTDNNGTSLTHMSQFQLFPDSLPDPVTSIKDIKSHTVLEKITVYSNKQAIQIDNTEAQKGTYQVYTITGALVKTGSLEMSNTIPVTNGLYIVKLVINNQMYTTKVMVK